MKKLISIVLAVFMVILAVPMMTVVANESTATAPVATEQELAGKSAGDTITVGGVDYVLIDEAKDVTDPAEDYYLLNDLVLDAPMTAMTTGKFNGGGNTITLGDGASTVFTGTIGASADCVISNFTVKGGDKTFTSSYVGVLSNTFTTGGHFYNITNYVNITSNSHFIGGLLGGVGDKPVANVTIEKCANYGSVKTTSTNTTNGFIGGILGGFVTMTAQYNLKVDVIDCVNYGAINGNNYVGGIVGGNYKSAVDNITITNCVNNGAVTATGTHAAGIMGGDQTGASGQKLYISINNCLNDAAITANGKCGASGIFGGTAGIVGPIELSISNCINKGELKVGTSFGAGGMVGYFDAPKAEVKLGIVDSVNSGKVTTPSGFAGGIVGGVYNSADYKVEVSIDGCVNKGNVSFTAAADYGASGILGATNQCHNATVAITSCANVGSITNESGDKHAAGIAFIARSNGIVATFDNCYNAGVVSGGHKAEIAVGWLYKVEYTTTLDISNCYAYPDNGEIYAAVPVGEDNKVPTIELTDSGKIDTSAEFIEKANESLTTCNARLYANADVIDVCLDHNHVTAGTPNTIGACSVCGYTADYAGFIQFNESTNKVRFVMVVDRTLDVDYTEFTMIISVNGNSTEFKSTELDAYESVTADGDQYTAAEGYLIFGAVVDMGTVEYNNANVQIVAGNTVLYSGSN